VQLRLQNGSTSSFYRDAVASACLQRGGWTGESVLLPSQHRAPITILVITQRQRVAGVLCVCPSVSEGYVTGCRLPESSALAGSRSSSTNAPCLQARCPTLPAWAYREEGSCSHQPLRPLCGRCRAETPVGTGSLPACYFFHTGPALGSQVISIFLTLA